MSQLRIGRDAVAAIVTDVAHYGALGVETGSLLLTSPGDPTITVLALAGAAGIERHPGLLVFSAAALNPLFSHAEDNGLQVRAQLHSHMFKAFLSETDQAGNIRMPGFIASVIPTFATPPDDVSEWRWWTFDGAEWMRSEPAITFDGNTKIITFDADGIHDN
jgi:hypothetical protein